MIKSNKIKIKLHEIENVQIGSVYIWKWIFHRGTSENIFTFWDVHGFLPQICYLLTSWLCAVVHHFCHLFLSTPFNFGVQNISMRLLICDSLWYNQRKAKTFPHQYKRRQISQKIGDKTNKMEKRRLWILEQTDKDKKYQHVWNQQITEGESKQSGAKCWGPCAFPGWARAGHGMAARVDTRALGSTCWLPRGARCPPGHLEHPPGETLILTPGSRERGRG